jgi:hypothetical protein
MLQRDLRIFFPNEEGRRLRVDRHRRCAEILRACKVNLLASCSRARRSQPNRSGG